MRIFKIFITSVILVLLCSCNNSANSSEKSLVSNEILPEGLVKIKAIDINNLVTPPEKLSEQLFKEKIKLHASVIGEWELYVQDNEIFISDIYGKFSYKLLQPLISSKTTQTIPFINNSGNMGSLKIVPIDTLIDGNRFSLYVVLKNSFGEKTGYGQYTNFETVEEENADGYVADKIIFSSSNFGDEYAVKNIPVEYGKEHSIQKMIYDCKGEEEEYHPKSTIKIHPEMIEIFGILAGQIVDFEWGESQMAKDVRQLAEYAIAPMMIEPKVIYQGNGITKITHYTYLQTESPRETVRQSGIRISIYFSSIQEEVIGMSITEKTDKCSLNIYFNTKEKQPQKETKSFNPNNNLQQKVDSKSVGGIGLDGDNNYRLGGRRALKKIKPDQNCDEKGTVSVYIEVDKAGSVIEAVPGYEGSTTSSDCLYEKSKIAALETRFNVDLDAPSEQVGVIFYHY